MCRIFGFRSVIQSQVHQSLVHADNALGLQSQDHPDGWGVAYYILGSPHVVKSSTTALQDSMFQKVSGVVSSETVIAHIRKSTQGKNTTLNTHPFQFGRWTFAHNGHIPNFDQVKPQLVQMVLPRFRRFVLGETDSEWIFYLIISHLYGNQQVMTRAIDLETLAGAVRAAMTQLEQLIGPISNQDVEGDLTRNYLTFVMTDGEAMVGFHGGKRLYYSTYKNRCSERDTCPSFALECEAASQTGFVNHLIFSSEPLSGENIWLEMKPGELLGVDWRMKLHKL